MPPEKRLNLLLKAGGLFLLPYPLVFVGGLFAHAATGEPTWGTSPSLILMEQCLVGGALLYPAIYLPCLFLALRWRKRGEFLTAFKLGGVPLAYVLLWAILFGAAAVQEKAAHAATLRASAEMEKNIAGPAPIGNAKPAPVSFASPIKTRLNPRQVMAYAERHSFSGRIGRDYDEERTLLSVRDGRLLWSVCFRVKGRPNPSGNDASTFEIDDATGKAVIWSRPSIAAAWDIPQQDGPPTEFSAAPVSTRRSPNEAEILAEHRVFPEGMKDSRDHATSVALLVRQNGVVWLASWATYALPNQEAFSVEVADESGAAKVVTR